MVLFSIVLRIDIQRRLVAANGPKRKTSRDTEYTDRPSSCMQISLNSRGQIYDIGNGSSFFNAILQVDIAV